MPENISKEVLIDIQLKLDEARQGIQAFTGDVNELAKSVKANKAAIVEAKAETAALTTELTRGKVEQQAVKTAIDKARLAQLEANKATREAKKNMVAAKGSYDEAQKSLTALGRAIKSAEGGFRSTDPAIKKQIADYKKLNAELTAFDKKLGNHQRNVGNYESALQGINGAISRLIPGFDQFKSILEEASKGFNAIGSSATDAETGMSGLSAGSMVLVGSLAAVGVGIAAVISYLTEFRNTGDQVTEFMGGLSEQFKNFGKNIVDMFKNKDFNPVHLFKGFKESFDKGIDISKLEIQAKHENEITETITKQRQTQADEFRAMSKNRTLDIADREKYLKQAQNIEDEIIQRQTDNADLQIKLALDVAEKNKKLLAPTRRRLEQGEGDIETANYLANQGEITEKGYQMYKAALDKRDEALRNANLKKIRQQDDAANIQLKSDNTEISEMALVTEAYKKAVSDRIASMARETEFTQDAFAKQLSTTQEHYRQLIFAQQKFIDEQEKIRDKSRFAKVKSQANKNIAFARGNISQIGSERDADIQKQITEYYRKVAEAVQKGQEQVSEMEIAGIQDVNKRELALMDAKQDAQQREYVREQGLLSENINKTTAEIAKAHGTEKEALQESLGQLLDLQGQNQDKARASLRKYLQDREKAVKAFSDQETALLDEAGILKAQRERDPKALLDAQQKQLLDQYNAEVSVKGTTDAKKLELEQRYLTDRDALNRQYQQRLQQQELQLTVQIQQSAFSVLQQSLERQNQAAEMYMERDKAHALQNQALTETQKYEISEKYRVLEGKQKVKEFHQEQEMNIAKAVMNGALAIVKAYAEEGPILASAELPFLIAGTALEIATIAAQRAPAYAKGGVHYDSDGRGGVLPGYSKTDNLNAHLRSGEGVVVSEAMRVPWARQIVSEINQSFGGRPFDSSVPIKSWATPGFASGGVFNNYLPVSDNGLRPSIALNQRMHVDDINHIVGGISDAVRNMPAPLVDVKDIAFQQNRYSQVYDRLNY